MNNVATRLTLIAACCGLVTSLAWALTQPLVLENRAEYANRLLREVAGMPGVLIEDSGDGHYRLTSSGEPTGFIFEFATNEGYNGRIGLWLAVNLEGNLLGVRVTDHRETPGIGDGIDLAVSDWILAFNGKSLTEPATWEVGRDFDKMTGATITSRAVTSAVHDGLDYYESERDRWLANEL